MKYVTGQALREAIEQRLRNASPGMPPRLIDSQRKQIVFDRFLARLLVVAPGAWVLKGGVALEFRFGQRARTTRDLDVASVVDEKTLVEFLFAATELDLGDFFTFVVEQIGEFENDEVSRTLRFRIPATLAGRRFETAHLDVAIEGFARTQIDRVPGSDFLSFAGIEPLSIPTVTLPQHLAEKLHAYTRIYGDGAQSSRVKDLVDIVLIVSERSFDAGVVTEQIIATFGLRGTQAVPERLPPPPGFWVMGYRALAGDINLDPDVTEGYRIAAAFFDPLLAGVIASDAVWSHDTMGWGLGS